MPYRQYLWLLLVALVAFVVWRYVWGSCWNPYQTVCFVGLSGGDHLQHYYAWIAYVHGGQSSWIPPRFSNWTWPIPVPLIYGDSIPLASILLAPIARITGQDFQYFSFFSLVSMLSSGYCGFRIALRQQLLGYQAALLGVLLAVSLPAIRRLTGHEALSLHAVLLVGITFLIFRVRSLAAWGALIFISAGIHAYFLPMVAILAAFAQLAIPTQIDDRQGFPEGKGERSGSRKKVLVNLGLFLGTTLISLFFYGYIPSNASFAGGDIWSANGLALVDSQGLSSLFAKPLDKLDPFQWEGFSYLGWSNTVVIIAAASLSLLDNGRERRSHESLFPSPRAYALVLILFFLYSLGTPWMVGDHVIWRLPDGMPVLSSFMNIFRSTGRFIWPVYYSLVIWGFIAICKRLSRPKFVILLVTILMLESYWPMAKYTRNVIREHYQQGKAWRAYLRSEPSELVRLIQGSELIVNATGNANLEIPSMPTFFVQAVHPTIATNYRPYLARLPKQPDSLMSLDPCQLSAYFLRQAEGRFDDAKILLMIPDQKVALCTSQYSLVRKYSLDPGRQISLYAPG